jgi:hypothetical protein
MPTSRKRQWVRPTAQPITASDGRADVADTRVRNVASISTPEN